MKNELEVYRELKAIRAWLKKMRADSVERADCGEAFPMAYGAQQALCWMLGTGMAPHKFEEVIDAVAAELERREAKP